MLETLNNLNEMTANGNDFLKGFLLYAYKLQTQFSIWALKDIQHESISRTYYQYSNRSPTRVANYTCLALTYLSKASESHESMRDLSFFLSPSVVILKSWFDVVAFLHPQYTLYTQQFQQLSQKENPFRGKNPSLFLSSFCCRVEQ